MGLETQSWDTPCPRRNRDAGGGRPREPEPGRPGEDESPERGSPERQDGWRPLCLLRAGVHRETTGLWQMKWMVWMWPQLGRAGGEKTS